MSGDALFHDVPFDGLEPERLVPTLPGLGLAMQVKDDGTADGLRDRDGSARG